MIDKIKPRTDENVRKLLKDAGLEDVNDKSRNYESNPFPS
jgi:hypothetical protein